MAAPRKPKNFAKGNVRGLTNALAALQGAEGVVPAALLELQSRIAAKIETGFRTETDPYGEKWQPPSERYLRRELDFDRSNFKLLQRSGGLKRRTKVTIIEGRMVKAENKAPHAHLMMAGTKKRVPGGIMVRRRFLPEKGELPPPWARDLVPIPGRLMKKAGMR